MPKNDPMKKTSGIAPWRDPKFCAQSPENARWLKLVAQAWKTNAKRDASERASGLASPSGSPFMLLQTGLQAISAGLATGDWPCVAEGFVMVQLVEEFLRLPLLEAHEKRYPPRQRRHDGAI